MVGTNKAHSMAKTAVICAKLRVMPNPTHRVVTDDIGWRLCTLVSIAERLELASMKTPITMMRMLKILWERSTSTTSICVVVTAVDLVQMRPDDPLELVATPPVTLINWQTVEEDADEDRLGNP